MFQIEWIDLATSSLAELWMKADSELRAEITSAIREIENNLKKDPSNVGESRRAGARVIVTFPLTVIFHVNVRTNVVLISEVRLHKRRDD